MSASRSPLNHNAYNLYRPEGTACLVALPETKLPAYKPTALIGKGVTIAGVQYAFPRVLY